MCWAFILLLGTSLWAQDLRLKPRVVTFGDSLTAPRDGVITYSEVLSKELAGAGIPVEVINSGIPGNTSTDARIRFETDVLSRAPDLVVIQLGANDAAADVWKSPPVTAPRVDITTYRRNLEYFIRSLRKQGANIILVTPNRFAWTPRLRELYGRPPYRVEDNDGFNLLLDKYADVMREVALRENVPLIDAARAVPATALVDGMHPSSEGHRIVAELLLPVVRKVLRKP